MALVASFAISGAVSASERHRHHKPSAQRIAAERGNYDESYAGHRTDIAGNSYFYYRVGADTPFGAGRVLRPPYPR